jgi:transposase
MIEQCFGGIDVSQDRLDVLLLPQATRFSVGNDEAGWNALSARLSGLPLAAIGLEPSGGYERGVIRALLSAASILIGFGSSPAPAALSPRMIGSMRA